METRKIVYCLLALSGSLLSIGFLCYFDHYKYHRNFLTAGFMCSAMFFVFLAMHLYDKKKK
jgi:hypothetical protein